MAQQRTLEGGREVFSMSDEEVSPIVTAGLPKRVNDVFVEQVEQIIVETAEGGAPEMSINTASILYPDGTPIDIKIVKSGKPGAVILSDEGRTIAYLQATARSLNNPESLDRFMTLWNQVGITRDGDVLSVNYLDAILLQIKSARLKEEDRL